MKNFSKVILSVLMFLVSSLAAGMEVNILSERQEFLLKPFLEQFEKDTGIKANVVYLKKGGLERIQAQPGAIDLVLTVDISNLTKMNSTGLFQKYNSAVIDQNIPENFRDPKGHWTALTARARIIYYSKESSPPQICPPMKLLQNRNLKAGFVSGQVITTIILP